MKSNRYADDGLQWASLEIWCGAIAFTVAPESRARTHLPDRAEAWTLTLRPTCIRTRCLSI
jgi:hypothetical protein